MCSMLLFFFPFSTMKILLYVSRVLLRSLMSIWFFFLICDELLFFKNFEGFPINFQWSYISLKYFPLSAPILYFLASYKSFKTEFLGFCVGFFFVILRNSQNYFFKIFLPYLDFFLFLLKFQLYDFLPKSIVLLYFHLLSPSFFTGSCFNIPVY